MSKAGRKGDLVRETPRKKLPEELVIRRLDILFARTPGYTGRPLAGAKYRYVKTPDVRDDELGYGDQLEVRFITVGEAAICERRETVIRARSGRLLAPGGADGVPEAVIEEVAERGSAEYSAEHRRLDGDSAAEPEEKPKPAAAAAKKSRR
jgi:hypothetical protein